MFASSWRASPSASLICCGSRRFFDQSFWNLVPFKCILVRICLGFNQCNSLFLSRYIVVNNSVSATNFNIIHLNENSPSIFNLEAFSVNKQMPVGRSTGKLICPFGLLIHRLCMNLVVTFPPLISGRRSLWLALNERNCLVKRGAGLAAVISIAEVWVLYQEPALKIFYWITVFVQLECDCYWWIQLGRLRLVNNLRAIV